MSGLAIVMYHYVREARGPFARLPAITPRDFRAELDAILARWRPVTVAEVAAALDGESLRDDACLLTFDDGYAEHYATVFPLLAERGAQGVFFPVARAARERRVLDVNKIQLLLATVDARELFARVRERIAGEAASAEWLARAARDRSRFDEPATVAVKRLFQRELPQPLRSSLLDALFREHVSGDERDIAESLYMSPRQIAEMAGAGMAIGGHSDTHPWLSRLGVEAQAREIDRSLDLLESVGARRGPWCFAYPFGAFDTTTETILAARGCAFALTVHPARADLTRAERFRLSRLDTRDVSGALQHKDESAINPPHISNR